jgi:D-Ala-D-Ala carboxypeptidase 3 (S13) family
MDRVQGRTKLARAGGWPLAVRFSPPLPEILREMDVESGNHTAELLLKQLGAREHPSEDGDADERVRPERLRPWTLRVRDPAERARTLVVGGPRSPRTALRQS